MLLTMSVCGAEIEKIQNVTSGTKEIMKGVYSQEKGNKNEQYPGGGFSFPFGVIQPTKDVLIFVANKGSGLYVYRIDVFFCSDGNWNKKKRIVFSTRDKKKCPASASVQKNIVTIIDGYGKEIGKVDLSQEEKESDIIQSQSPALQKLSC